MLAKSLPLLKIKLKEGFVCPSYSNKYMIIRYAIEEILSSEFIQEFVSVDLELREAQLFISPPSLIGGIHIDGHNLDLEAAAINYVLNNNTDWSMQWFHATIDTVNKSISSGNTSYISLSPEQCKLIYEFNTTDPFLVQVGTPHRIVNFSTLPRYCLSLRFKQSNFSTVLKNANRYCTEI